MSRGIFVSQSQSAFARFKVGIDRYDHMIGNSAPMSHSLPTSQFLRFNGLSNLLKHIYNTTRFLSNFLIFTLHGVGATELPLFVKGSPTAAKPGNRRAETLACSSRCSPRQPPFFGKAFFPILRSFSSTILSHVNSNARQR